MADTVKKCIIFVEMQSNRGRAEWSGEQPLIAYYGWCGERNEVAFGDA